MNPIPILKAMSTQFLSYLSFPLYLLLKKPPPPRLPTRRGIKPIPNNPQSFLLFHSRCKNSGRG